MLKFVLAGGIAAVAMSGIANADTLRLQCTGVITQQRAVVTQEKITGQPHTTINQTVNIGGSRFPNLDSLGPSVEVAGAGTETRTITTYVPTQTNLTFIVEVSADNTLRVRGLAGDWFNVIKSRITDDVIAGQIRFGVFDKPIFHIDRMSGAMSVTGISGTFEGGSCDRLVVTERKF